MTKWNYSGDVNLEHGGFFWREPDDTGTADYVDVVDVVPCSDAGGPDNLFVIEVGDIFIGTDPERIASALGCIGETPANASRADIVYAMKAYSGIERDHAVVVRIGKVEEPSSFNGWNPPPDKTLRGNTKLANYVKREFLA